MIDINTVVLENGIEYTEVDDLIYNNTRYVLLANVDNVKDSCIRKIKINDDGSYISRLSDSEFNIILDMFIEKNEALFN